MFDCDTSVTETKCCDKMKTVVADISEQVFRTGIARIEEDNVMTQIAEECGCCKTSTMKNSYSLNQCHKINENSCKSANL